MIHRLFVRPAPEAAAADAELDTLRQQLAAVDRDLTKSDTEQARLLGAIAERERVLHRDDAAAAERARREEEARRAALLAEHQATGQEARAAYMAYRASGIALLTMRQHLQRALDRHEDACRAAGNLPTMAVDSAGLALGAGELPDFREWGKV